MRSMRLSLPHALLRSMSRRSRQLFDWSIWSMPISSFNAVCRESKNRLAFNGCHELIKMWRSTLRRAGTTRHDLLIQFLIHDLDRAIDLVIGHAKLMRDQLHQQVDPLDERRSTGYRAGRG